MKRGLPFLAVSLLLVFGIFLPSAVAQTSNPGGFLGGTPAFLDNDGNATPASGETLGLARTGSTLTLTGGFSWGVGRSTANLGFTPGMSLESAPSMYTSIFNNFRGVQSYLDCLTVVNGACTKMGAGQIPLTPSALERRAESSSYSAIFNLVDQNNDGNYEFIRVDRPGMPTVSMNLMITTIGGKKYVGIPWGFAGLLRVKPGVGPVYIPLSTGNKVAFDFDGDSVADPDLLASPALADPTIPVPTLGEWGLLLLLSLLMGYGVLRLSRSRETLSLS